VTKEKEAEPMRFCLFLVTWITAGSQQPLLDQAWFPLLSWPRGGPLLDVPMNHLQPDHPVYCLPLQILERLSGLKQPDSLSQVFMLKFKGEYPYW